MLADIALETVRSLRAHTLRFALTALGVAWGVAMLTYLSASADGYDRHFERKLDEIGPRIVFLFPGTVTKRYIGQRGARPVELERKDVARLAELASVERAAPNQWLGPRVLRAGRRTKLVWLYGASEDTAPIRGIDVAAGRLLSRRDVDTGANAVVLGAKVAARLFGDAPAVGRQVHIEGIPFEVVGVARAKGQQLLYMGPADDQIALVPITTARTWFTRSKVIDQVVFAPRTRAGSREAVRHVSALIGLHEHFRADDETAMSHFNIQEIVDLVRGLLLGLRLFLTTASLVTLFVGAVGIMNIMLVVVSERRREIGLRKAVGASNRAIFVQLLAETATVTVAAGLVGALLGCLAVGASAAAVEAGSLMQAPPLLRAGAVLWIVSTLVGTGLAAGLLPALRAMRIDPAVALRAT